jgi:hypothetical protein
MNRLIASVNSILVWTHVAGQDTSRGKLEWELYTIKQTNFEHAYPVAFSIGYPKGWNMSEGLAIAGPEAGKTTSPRNICVFSAPAAASRSDIIWIFRTDYGSTAKKDAEDFVKGFQTGSNPEPTLAEVKTKAGDSGYLAMRDDERPNGQHVSYYDFFFHVGKKGHIRISITSGELHESLRNLVLETLRFDKG